MNVLKEAPVSSSVIALPNSIGHMTLNTDTWDKKVACVLLHKQEDETTRPVGYWSHSLNYAEKSYYTTQRKFFAIVWSVLILHPDLGGTSFTLRAEYASLK